MKNDKKITYRIQFISSIRLCQPHYQVLLIIYLKGFITINAQILSLVLTTCQPKMIN